MKRSECFKWDIFYILIIQWSNFKVHCGQIENLTFLPPNSRTPEFWQIPESSLHSVPLGTLSSSSLHLSVLCSLWPRKTTHPSWEFDPVPLCPACPYMPGETDCPGMRDHETIPSPEPSDYATFPQSIQFELHFVFPSGTLCSRLLSCAFITSPFIPSPVWTLCERHVFLTTGIYSNNINPIALYLVFYMMSPCLLSCFFPLHFGAPTYACKA